MGTRKARLSLDDGDGAEEGYDVRDGGGPHGQDVDIEGENDENRNDFGRQDQVDRNVVEYTYHTDDFGQDSKYNNPEDEDDDDDINGI